MVNGEQKLGSPSVGSYKLSRISAASGKKAGQHVATSAPMQAAGALVRRGQDRLDEEERARRFGLAKTE